MSFGIQPIHIVFIFIVALLLFGPKRLPEIGRSVGKALNEFRRMTNGMTDVINQEMREPTIMPPVNNATSGDTVLPTPGTSDTIQSPPASQGMAGSACPVCGSLNIAEAHFCNKCGTRLPEKTT
ncbi:MAG TPA: twin-arginine translocase TatA/TatE family subunit [Anaerolineales bacterium]